MLILPTALLIGAVAGLAAGLAGAVAGTYGGAAIRARLAGAFGRDWPAALAEDSPALGCALLIVWSMS